jgi:LacI family transcriptional regulator
MATIKDVAARAGVSVATVSHVMNGSRFVTEETQKRVTQAIADLGYRRDGIARSLRRSRTGTIGAVVSDITNPFFSDLVKGIGNTIHGFADRLNVILCNSEEDEALEREVLDILMEKRVDGLIIAPAGGNAAYLEALGKEGPPIVFVDRALPGIVADSVTVDNVSASEEAVRHLIEGGRSRIAVLKATLRASSIEERVQGYRHAMAKAGKPAKAEWIVESASNIDAAHEAGRRLLGMTPRPEAVFCTNNFMTLGLVRALNEAGLSAPDDVGIVGFDDFQWAEAFRPRITAIAQSGYEQGVEAANLLAARIGKAERGPPVHRVIGTKLIIRESSG